jgi:hypothetical protein
MEKRSLIDPNNFISKSYLESLGQAVNTAQKTMESLANSSALQSFIKNQSKIQEMVQSVAKSFEPAFESMKAQQELIKSIKSWDLYSTYTPQLTYLAPQKEIVIANKVEEKSFTKKEMEEVVKLAIAETLEKARNQEININATKRFPYKLPANVSWGDIIIKFLDGHNIQIVAGKQVYKANYKEMGLDDSRQLKPNLQWALLKALSENNGGVSWKEGNAKNNVKKQKQLLSTKLKNYFNIESEPFYSYKKQLGYQIKITLVPESGSINNHMPEYQGDDKEEDDSWIKDSYKNFVE